MDWVQQVRPAALPDLMALVQATAALLDCPAASVLLALRDPHPHS